MRWPTAVIACHERLHSFLPGAPLVSTLVPLSGRWCFHRDSDVCVEALLHDRGGGQHRPDGAGDVRLQPGDRSGPGLVVAAWWRGVWAWRSSSPCPTRGGSWGWCSILACSPSRRARLREGWLWGTIVFTALFLGPLIWWWRGPQVADVARTRILNAWPLSHGFSLNQGFHFIGLEAFYLCPLFLIVLVVVLGRLGSQLWEDPRYGLMVCLAAPGLIWQNLVAFFHEGRFELVPALFPALWCWWSAATWPA